MSEIHAYTLIIHINYWYLRGDLGKGGPGYFASEKSFPSNFAQ